MLVWASGFRTQQIVIRPPGPHRTTLSQVTRCWGLWSVNSYAILWPNDWKRDFSHLKYALTSLSSSYTVRESGAHKKIHVQVIHIALMLAACLYTPTLALSLAAVLSFVPGGVMSSTILAAPARSRFALLR